MDGNKTVPELTFLYAGGNRWSLTWTCVHCGVANAVVCPGCWKPMLFRHVDEDETTHTISPIGCCNRNWRGMDDIICFCCVPVSGFLFLLNISSIIGL